MTSSTRFRAPIATLAGNDAVTDLLDAYAAACDRYQLAERAVAQAADERGRVVARMAYAGMSLADIGEAVGVASRGRVHELVKRGRAALARDAEPCAAIAAQTVDVDPTTLAAARSMLADLRARLRREASEVATRHRDILADADSLRIWWPRQGRPGEYLRGGEQDWLRGLDPAERQRLRGWRADTAAYSVDNLAARLRDAHPAIDDDGMTDDQLVAEVWLHHSRIIDAAGAVARGRVPRSVRYSGASCAHPDRMGLPIGDDGYRPSLLLADDDTAAHHVAEVLADRESLEAEQYLSDRKSVV